MLAGLAALLLSFSGVLPFTIDAGDSEPPVVLRCDESERRAVGVAVDCLQAVQVQRDIAHGFIVDAARIGGGLMADLWSTEYALARRPDLRESNPLGITKNARMWLKGMMAAAVIAICDKLRRDGHHGWATWLGRGAFVLQAGAATSNVVKAHSK